MNRESDLLKKWTLERPAPAGFNATVWRRIEARRPPSLTEAIRHWMTGLFAKRAVAAAYLSLAAAVGLAAAQAQSSKVLRERESQLQARYLQSVDPYAARVTR